LKVPGQNPYEKYIEHIETCITSESPLFYGLHPNAEIGFRTDQCKDMFNKLLELQPRDSGSEEKSGDIKSANEIASDLIKELIEDKNISQMIFN